MKTLDKIGFSLQKKHQIFGWCSAVCWWMVILTFLVHLWFCLDPEGWDYFANLDNALFQTGFAYQVISIIWWVILSVLYGLVELSIIKQNIKGLLILSIAGLILPFIRCFFMRAFYDNFIWDLACWLLVLYWIISYRMEQKRGDRWQIVDFIKIVPAFILFFRRYYNPIQETFSESLAVGSWFVQDMLRTFAMILLGLWFISFPRKSDPS